MDDFDRNVYCLAGLPFDALGYADALSRIQASVTDRSPCFLSTPNLDFLIACQSDTAFRDSVIHSDLSVADGMPLVWLARLLSIPIRERVAGSSLFERLREPHSPTRRSLSVYFFGGPEGVAESACRKLNDTTGLMICAGFQSPGFGTVETMSGDDRIALINASDADFLVVSLGARKGQAWIERNRSSLKTPVIGHLGAVVNFVAGTVSRAPVWMQQAGLEWLWRIGQEPALWRRYELDALGLARLFLGRALPYALWKRLARAAEAGLSVRVLGDDEACRVEVEGTIPDAVPAAIRVAFRSAASRKETVVVDLTRVGVFGPGFLGQLLMLKKHQDRNGKALRITGLSRRSRRLLRWNGAEYLIDR